MRTLQNSIWWSICEGAADMGNICIAILDLPCDSEIFQALGLYTATTNKPKPSEGRRL